MQVTFTARGSAGAIASFCADLGALMAKHGLLDDEPARAVAPMGAPMIGRAHEVASATLPPIEALGDLPPLPAPAEPAAPRKRRERSDKGRQRNGAAAPVETAAPLPVSAPVAEPPKRATTAEWGSPPKVPAAPSADDWGIKPAAAKSSPAPAPAATPAAPPSNSDDDKMRRFLQAAVSEPGGFEIVAKAMNDCGVATVTSLPADKREPFVRAVLGGFSEASRKAIMAFTNGGAQ